MSKLQLGINKISNKDYHSDSEYLSSSDLKLILKDPNQFYEEKILGNKKIIEGDFFAEGSLLHTLILEPHLLHNEYVFYDGLRKVGVEWEIFKAQHTASGKTLMSKPQLLRCKSWVDGFKKNKTAVELIKDGEAEHTICAEMNGVKIKVRTDYINLNKNYIIDLKTSSFPVDIDSFKMTADNYNYLLSGTLYAAIAELHYGKKFDFYLIPICKKDSTCEVFKLSEESRLKGMQQIIKALNLYKKCKESGIWNSEKKEINFADYEILEI